MTFASTALILLASGNAKRFEDGDKLTTLLNGKPVASYAATCLKNEAVGRRIAVIGRSQTGRRALLSSLGWDIIANPDPSQGQGVSLSLGVKSFRDDEDIDNAMILLADMPLVPDTHLKSLAGSMCDGTEAVMTQVGEITCPPAIFARSTFEALSQLQGDRGAKSAFQTLTRTQTIQLDATLALDVDRQRDLETAEEIMNG